MKTVKGPAIFLAQFVDQNAPFNSLDSMCKWAADLGYKGIQIPTWETFAATSHSIIWDAKWMEMQNM